MCEHAVRIELGRGRALRRRFKRVQVQAQAFRIRIARERAPQIVRNPLRSSRAVTEPKARMRCEIREQPIHEAERRGRVSGVSCGRGLRQPGAQVIAEAGHEAGFVRRIDDAAAIHRADAQRGADADGIIGAQLLAHLALVVAAAIAVVGVHGGGHAVRQHAGGGQPGHGKAVENAARAATGNPGFEKVVAIAELDLTQAPAVLMRVDEAGHQQAVRQGHDARLRPARQQRLRIADLGYSARSNGHPAVSHQAVGAGRRKHIVRLQDYRVGHRNRGAAVDRVAGLNITFRNDEILLSRIGGAQMPAWDEGRSARRPTFGWSDGRALLVMFVLAVGVGAYAYRHSPSASQWPSVSHGPAPSKPFTGAVRVADGDSLVVAGMRIRLMGIDAPELNQTCTDAKGMSWPCGRTAQRELRAHLGRRALKCEPHGSDRFKRVLAVCFLPDGANVNAWMVRQGWAVASGYSGTYRSEQDEAKAAKRGIWAGTFMFPAEWRQRNS